MYLIFGAKALKCEVFNIGSGRTKTTARAGRTVPISLRLPLVEIFTTLWLWIHWELHLWHCLTRLGGQ